MDYPKCNFVIPDGGEKSISVSRVVQNDAAIASLGAGPMNIEIAAQMVDRHRRKRRVNNAGTRYLLKTYHGPVKTIMVFLVMANVKAFWKRSTALHVTPVRILDLRRRRQLTYERRGLVMEKFPRLRRRGLRMAAAASGFSVKMKRAFFWIDGP